MFGLSWFRAREYTRTSYQPVRQSTPPTKKISDKNSNEKAGRSSPIEIPKPSIDTLTTPHAYLLFRQPSPPKNDSKPPLAKEGSPSNYGSCHPR